MIVGEGVFLVTCECVQLVLSEGGFIELVLGDGDVFLVS